MTQSVYKALITPSVFILALLRTDTAQSAGILIENFKPVPLVRTKILMHSAADRIAGQYIVKLRNDVSTRALDSVISQIVPAQTVKHRYQTVFRGFSAELSEDELNQLAMNEEVEFIEEDSIIRASEVQLNPPSWGLDRLNQPDLGLDKRYSYNRTGRGVNAYIVDTGIRLSHSEFQGRAVGVFTSINDGRGSNDCNGHGTHVAGTVGGKTYGVAKNVKLNAVRVLDCNGSGPTSGVIAGIEWVHANHIAPAVINMSLGGVASASIDAAVKAVSESSVTVVVAAGNSGKDACNESPSRAPEAITVGATTRTDSRAGFSNFGRCVDLFAPGENITSAWMTSDTSTNTISGTSMASPHVAGVAALYLEGAPRATPAEVDFAIKSGSVFGRVKSAGVGSANYLLQSQVAEPFETPCLTAQCKAYSGTLNVAGSLYQPNGSYYYAGAGLHEVWLRAAAFTDFDVELMQWVGNALKVVAQGIGPTSNEHFTLNGAAGYYTVRVSSSTGAGSYNLWVKTPQ